MYTWITIRTSTVLTLYRGGRVKNTRTRIFSFLTNWIPDKMIFTQWYHNSVDASFQSISILLFFYFIRMIAIIYYDRSKTKFTSILTRRGKPLVRKKK